MKAEDVMKALELCNTPRSGVCKICPYHEFGASCHTKRNADALALLREKDADIERLKEMIDTSSDVVDYAVDKIREARASMLDEARRLSFEAGDQQYISIAELEKIVKGTAE